MTGMNGATGGKYLFLLLIGAGAVQAVFGVFDEEEPPDEVKNTASSRMEEIVSTGDWHLPTSAKIGTPYRQAGSAWASGYHTGVDFLAPAGTEVKSVGKGRVISAGWGGKYGNEVVIQHRDGVYSQYAHLSRIDVQSGATVTGGQRIGLSGNTGNSFGAHLHFEARTGPAYGSDMNPVTWLREHGVTL